MEMGHQQHCSLILVLDKNVSLCIGDWVRPKSSLDVVMRKL